MKHLRLKIIANNQDGWRTWPEEIAKLQDFFRDKVLFTTSLVHTRYQNIPFVKYMANPDRYGVDYKWYDDNVASLATDYDIVLFSMPTIQWKDPHITRGWRVDANLGPIELQVAANEGEKFLWPGMEGQDLGTTFYNYARHEILHALFMMTGQNDTTHYWWDKGQLHKALEEVVFPEPREAEIQTLTARIIALMWQVIAYLKAEIAKYDEPPLPPIDEPPVPPPSRPGPTITDMALAMQEFEDWVLPGGKYRDGRTAPQGSLTWRLKNPGALKFANQVGNIGEKQGFAVFPDYETGFKALYRQIQIGVNGTSKVYNPEMPLYNDTYVSKEKTPHTRPGFFQVYAPIHAGEVNHPFQYATWVAGRLGVSVDYQIKNLRP